MIFGEASIRPGHSGRTITSLSERRVFLAFTEKRFLRSIDHRERVQRVRGECPPQKLILDDPLDKLAAKCGPERTVHCHTLIRIDFPLVPSRGTWPYRRGKDKGAIAGTRLHAYRCDLLEKVLPSYKWAKACFQSYELKGKMKWHPP